MIDLENASLREAEQAAYAAGDTLKPNCWRGSWT
jgi:hypothetical protein